MGGEEGGKVNYDGKCATVRVTCIYRSGRNVLMPTLWRQRAGCLFCCNEQTFISSWKGADTAARRRNVAAAAAAAAAAALGHIVTGWTARSPP